LATADNLKSDEGKMAAEGHCNVGLSLEDSGELQQAAKHYESFYALTEGHEEWTFDNEQMMHCEACKHLTRIYTTIAQGCQDLVQSIEYLTKATEMSLKSKYIHSPPLLYPSGNARV
jgi:hypothetical protein